MHMNNRYTDLFPKRLAHQFFYEVIAFPSFTYDRIKLYIHTREITESKHMWCLVFSNKKTIVSFDQTIGEFEPTITGMIRIDG
jgi:superfamily I DNA and/or RNA helicase